MDRLYNSRNMTDGSKKRIQYIRQEDPDYPERLRVHRGMPKGLYVRGKLPAADRPAVAVVGARRSDSYGNETARRFARELAAKGVQIISGMAWGIDGMAHKGALEAGGDTFAVLGCGVDICYPPGHQSLYEELLIKGGVLSEQPPGMPPLAGHFPARNRIISGLSDLVPRHRGRRLPPDLVLVVEAREKSGSLITADQALEQGKDVYAVPGRAGDALSRGCHGLIRQGAGLADSPEIILEVLGISSGQNREPEKILLAKEENIVYSWIRLQPVSLDELVKKTGMPVRKVLQILVGLELKGCIREIQKNDYIRTD